MTTTHLGWRLATFLADRVTPANGHTIASHELFQAYETWCRGQGAVPYLEGYFLRDVAAIADACGVVVQRTGSHLSLLDVALVGEG